MFEKLIRELEKMEKGVSIPILADDEGYIDKECPSINCLFQFKVFEKDWADVCKDEAVYCPKCGHSAPVDSFWTTAQIENSEKQGMKYFNAKINKALSANAKEFNKRQPKNSFINMSMSYKSSMSSNYYILPIPAEKELTQKITCSKCLTRYSVLGSAFFCPRCGYNSVLETYENSILKIESKMKNLDVIREAVVKVSADEAEITIQSLIESGLSDGVVAFQRFCELTYKNMANEDQKIKANAFQNLEIGGKYWLGVYGESYENWLSRKEFQRLIVLFQQRHLLAHCEGIVDEKYMLNSGDSTYSLNQRIVVKKKDVLELVELIKKIINKIRELTNS